MKSRLWLSSLILMACIGLRAQNDQPKPAPDATPAQPTPSASPSPTEAPPASSPEQSQPQSAPEQAQPADSQDEPRSPQPQIKHDGGKNDVDAIGNRKVGGFDMYSIETDIKIGKAYSQQIERVVKIIDDPVVNEFVNRLGQNLVRNSDAKFPYTFKIVDADDINAMTLPGGWVYINTGMILAADDEAELAGGMAHEIAHAALRHGTRGQTRANMLQLLTVPVMVMGGPVGVIGTESARLALPLSLLKFSREFEAEADYFGVEYMYKAGYDPNGLIMFFEKVQAVQKKKPGAVSKAFSTHPQTPDRISKSQQEISKILSPRDMYLETTSEFSDVKARLAMIENRRKIEDANPSKPNLRRAADSPANGDKKDDRPTLEKHDRNFTLVGER